MALFTYLLICVLFSLARCEPESNCSTDGILISSRLSQICCNGEIYTTRRYGAFDYSCNVEPKDKDLSYEDSTWLAYECHVRIWMDLESLHFSLESYATLMSQLLPVERQVDLQSKRMSDRVETSGSDDARRLKIIKVFIREYYRAIKEVCIYGNETADTTSRNESEIAQLEKDMAALQQPIIKCKNDIASEFIYHNFPGNEKPRMAVQTEDDEIKACKKKMKGFVGRASSPEILNNATRFCFLILYENFDINKIQAPLVDFEGIITDFLPRFWSKTAKSVAKDAVLKILSRDYASDAKDFKGLFADMLKVGEENFESALKQGEAVTDRQLLINAFITHHIYNVCGYVRYNVMCQKGGEPFERNSKQESGKTTSTSTTASSTTSAATETEQPNTSRK